LIPDSRFRIPERKGMPPFLERTGWKVTDMGTGDKMIWIIVAVSMMGTPITIIYSWYFAISKIVPAKQS
jgi:hypothetical protein